MMQKNSRIPNWWRRRITLEKFLMLIFALLANQMIEEFKSTALASGRGKSQTDDTTKTVPGSSLDARQEEWDRTANDVLNKMNKQVKPCDNFYEFACGNYIKTTKIPDDKDYVDEFVNLESKVREQLKQIVAEERPAKDPNYLKLPNILYKSCMNEKLIEDLGTKNIEKISASLGGWPVIVGASWDKDNKWTWQETVKKFRRLGFNTNIVLKLSVTADLKDPTKHCIELDQFSPVKVKLNSYQIPMIDTAVLLGAEREAAKKELKKSKQFEQELKAISLSLEEMRNPNDLYNPQTVKQLQKSYPYVQWLDYINGILPEGSKIDENKVINVRVPSYFDRLGELLQKTRKRDLANYMMWRMHEEIALSLQQKFRMGNFNQRWMDCIDFISDRLKFATGSLYVRKHFQKDSKAAASAMIKYIRNTFSQTFDGLNWMDQITKKEAKKKLNAMKDAVGYAEELLDNAKLEEYHRQLEIYPDKLMQSILTMNVFFEDKSLNELQLPVVNNEWTTLKAPQIVNAAYRFSKNIIEIPAAIMQGYFFNAHRPNYMNYGAIGSIIGHEITHAFDEKGRQFGADAKLVNWWQPNTEKAFLEKAKCIIKQYSDFKEKDTEKNIDGDRTQGENIADNGGYKHAYLGYKQWVAENSLELPLPGLKEYTSNQLFWISAAQSLCEKYTKSAMRDLINYKEHPPAEIRILAAFSNIDGFSSEFKCPANSPMNPAHKCKVW